MLKSALLLLGFAALLFGPIALRPKESASQKAGGRELIVISPHNEAIRSEFGRAFAEYHRSRTGETIRVDWRAIGGTSEIVRYIDSQYSAAFQKYWEETLGRQWSSSIAGSFANPRTVLPASGAGSIEQQARSAFLASGTSCGVDVFFGGGAFDFQREAAGGNLVDWGFAAAHPDLFGPGGIPSNLSGEPLWDAQGRWFGVCLAAFGICSSSESLQRLRIDTRPSSWKDLANPLLFHEVALANPTQSGSVNRAFELLIQQQLADSVEEAKRSAGPRWSGEEETTALRVGWERAMRLLIKIGGNARYFTDSASKVSIDVAAGDAAAGMTIDFYGRFESEAVRTNQGSSRMQFANAAGGTSFSPDPIGLLRGAPHPELAKEFIAWTLSTEGQKLWDWKTGAAGGPQRYALRRLPIVPALYSPEFRSSRSDPEVNPYEPAVSFTYHPEWTRTLFQPIAFIVRVMCIDPHDELADAWSAVIAAGFPPEAMHALLDTSAVTYDEARGEIAGTLTHDKLSQIQLANRLANGFRMQYRRAAELARSGR